jgi:heme A synthase
MIVFLRVAGWLFLIVAAFFGVLTVISLPPGGLMFALPYLLGMITIAAAAIGGGLLLLARRLLPPAPAIQPESDGSRS